MFHLYQLVSFIVSTFNFERSQTKYLAIVNVNSTLAQVLCSKFFTRPQHRFDLVVAFLQREERVAIANDLVAGHLAFQPEAVREELGQPGLQLVNEPADADRPTGSLGRGGGARRGARPKIQAALGAHFWATRVLKTCQLFSSSRARSSWGSWPGSPKTSCRRLSSPSVRRSLPP